MNLFQLIYWEIERKCSAFSLSLALCRRHRHHWCCCFFSLVLIRIVRLVSIFTLINEIVCIHFAVLLMDRCIVTLIHSAFSLVYVSSMSIESELRLRENLSSSVSHQKNTISNQRHISSDSVRCALHSLEISHSFAHTQWMEPEIWVIKYIIVWWYSDLFSFHSILSLFTTAVSSVWCMY